MRSLSPVVSIYLLALLGVLLAAMVGAAFFATLPLIIACLVKSHERFMGIGQVLTMPLFLASNAIYPIAIARLAASDLAHQPADLRSGRAAGADAGRGMTIFGVGVDYAVLIAATTVLVVVAGKLYPRVAV